MPLITQAPVGATTVVSAMLNEQQLISVAGANVVTQPLAVDQLPNVTVVMIERAAVANACSYFVEFALRSTGTAVSGPNLDWLPFTPPQVGPTPVGIPLVLNFGVPCNFIRINFTQAAGLTHSIEFMIGAFSP